MWNKSKSILTFFWRNALTTITGIQANLDNIIEPTSTKMFINGILAIIIFTMLPDDTIGRMHDNMARKFGKIEPEPKPEELPQ